MLAMLGRGNELKDKWRRLDLFNNPHTPRFGGLFLSAASRITVPILISE